jgi:hypothetical protein
VNRKGAQEWRAWYTFVRGQQGPDEHDELVFAPSRSQAIYKSDAYFWCGEWIEVGAVRVPFFDRWADPASPGPTDRDMLEGGWSVWCYGCNNAYLSEGDALDGEAFIDPETGGVFCEACWSKRPPEGLPVTAPKIA